MLADIRLMREPLDVAGAVAAVTCEEAGGIDVFLGTTRAESHPEFGKLAALEYHGYEELAVKELQRLATAAQGRWPIVRLVIWHRLGVVRVGEASVVIAVSCAHRGEAFEACRFIIDELKKSVPLWKKELYARRSHWQGDPTAPPPPSTPPERS